MRRSERASALLPRRRTASIPPPLDCSIPACPLVQSMLFAASTRPPLRRVQELLRSMEEKLAQQREMQSDEFSGLEAKYQEALRETRQAGRKELDELTSKAEAREAALLERLRLQGEEAAREADSATARADMALSQVPECL